LVVTVWRNQVQRFSSFFKANPQHLNGSFTEKKPQKCHAPTGTPLLVPIQSLLDAQRRVNAAAARGIAIVNNVKPSLYSTFGLRRTQEFPASWFSITNTGSILLQFLWFF
jgi:hypothetical protein